MLLAIAATEIEMAPFLGLGHFAPGRVQTLVCGVGPLESAVKATRYFEQHHRRIDSVVNFGIGGAYLHEETNGGVDVLDLCVATREVLGDYGVSSGLAVEPFSDPTISGPSEFPLDPELVNTATRTLQASGYGCHRGTFVTVNAASGNAARGRLLRERFTAICETMEGAAIARACQEFSLPLLELRSISNMVEDRPGKPWKLQEAADLAARAAALVIDTLMVQG